MRVFPALILFAAFAAANTASDLSFAEDIATIFYNNLETLSTGKESDASYEAGESCIQMAAGSHDNVRFPNEFKMFGIPNSDSHESLVCSSYISQFKKLASSGQMQFSYHIRGVIPFYEAEWSKSNNEASFVYCIVEKKYGSKIYNGIIRDTVLINGERKIIGIRNCAGGDAFTNIHNHTNIPNTGTNHDSPNTIVNIESLHFAAANYYNQKKYTEAYNAYQSITEYDSENANAYYRLALMSYRRQGCKQYTKHKTDEMAMTYIQKAYKTGNIYLRKKIENILYYWQ